MGDLVLAISSGYSVSLCFTAMKRFLFARASIVVELRFVFIWVLNRKVELKENDE